MRRVALLVAKDLRVLRRSPVLVVVLVAYPLLVAVLVGMVASFGSARPRVALVDLDGLPDVIEVAGSRFHIQRTIDRVAKEIELVRLAPEDAQRELETGEIVASVTVPPGFTADLRSTVRSPSLLLELTRGGIAPRARQQMQALVYQLNQALQERYIEADIRYLELLVEGGRTDFLGRELDVLGLDGAERELAALPPGPRVERLREFIAQAKLFLSQTDDALVATAHPIELEEAPDVGRTWALSAQVQAYALALTVALLTLVLAAGAIASERDENVIGRLARGLVRLGELVAAKIALAALVAVGLGLAIVVVFGLTVELADVIGGQPWDRLPLLLAGVALAGASLGAIGVLLGALAREARTASLVALLVVLPLVFLGLVPRNVAAPAAYVSDALPFAHAVRFFDAALYDAGPWGTVAVEAGWLAGIGLVFAALARLFVRRLLA
jgi:ABC-2 type transport system permease protein